MENGNGKAKLLERVRKLLTLATHANTSEAEAAAAMSRVNVILAEHNLSMAEVEVHVGSPTAAEAASGRGHRLKRSFEKYLWMAAAELNFCDVFFMSGSYYAGSKWRGVEFDNRSDAKHWACVIGKPLNIEVVTLMAEYLISTVNRLARDGAKVVAPASRPNFRKNFRVACSRRVLQRAGQLVIQRKRGQQDEHSKGSNLPALMSLYETEQKAVVQFMEDQRIKIRTSKSRVRMDNFLAAEAGRRAAEGISLNQQVTGASETRKQISQN